MSATTGVARVERARREPRGLLEQYRDDGLLAQALERLGRAVPVPASVLAAVGVAGLVVLAALEGDGASDALVACGVAWMVLLGGLSSGRPHSDRFAWSVPGLLRVGEYGALVWIASNDGTATSAAAFALIAALAFRHYDLVYRPRYQGVAPPAWLQLAALGWDGRLALSAVLLASGALPGAMFALAAVLAVTFAVECTLSWVRLSTRPMSVYEDEEDEGQ